MLPRNDKGGAMINIKKPRGGETARFWRIYADFMDEGRGVLSSARRIGRGQALSCPYIFHRLSYFSWAKLPV